MRDKWCFFRRAGGRRTSPALSRHGDSQPYPVRTPIAPNIINIRSIQSSCTIRRPLQKARSSSQLTKRKASPEKGGRHPGQNSRSLLVSELLTSRGGRNGIWSVKAGDTSPRTRGSVGRPDQGSSPVDFGSSERCTWHNIGLEPSRQLSRAMMSQRRVAQAARYAHLGLVMRVAARLAWRRS